MENYLGKTTNVAAVYMPIVSLYTLPLYQFTHCSYAYDVIKVIKNFPSVVNFALVSSSYRYSHPVLLSDLTKTATRPLDH